MIINDFLPKNLIIFSKSLPMVILGLSAADLDRAHLLIYACFPVLVMGIGPLVILSMFYFHCAQQSIFHFRRIHVEE